ncbi:hypothetical protein Tco_1225940 [Tanacetum coccineum]
MNKSIAELVSGFVTTRRHSCSTGCARIELPSRLMHIICPLYNGRQISTGSGLPNSHYKILARLSQSDGVIANAFLEDLDLGIFFDHLFIKLTAIDPSLLIMEHCLPETCCGMIAGTFADAFGQRLGKKLVFLQNVPLISKDGILLDLGIEQEVCFSRL